MYFDYQATTPPADEAIAAVVTALKDCWGNPSAIGHRAGAAEQCVSWAKEVLSADLGFGPQDVVFTSGATEANNAALAGIAPSAPVVTSAVEHKSVLVPALASKRAGRAAHVVPVDGDGHVRLDVLDELLGQLPPGLLSIQAVSNETGTVQDLASLSRIAHTHGFRFHTDATQALGLDGIADRLRGADAVSCSAHKIYGPKGVGALFLRPAVRKAFRATIMGGGQQGGVRPGTENVPGIAGFAAAFDLLVRRRGSDREHVRSIRDRALSGLAAAGVDHEVQGGEAEANPGCLNLFIPGLDVRELRAQRPHWEFSTGSACSARTPDPSHVLLAMGRSEDQAMQSIRLGFGRASTLDEADVIGPGIAAALHARV